jgi:putative CRISPR-associated protein (TIGR02619 family)
MTKPRIFICTTGTSIANGCKTLRVFQASPEAISKETEDALAGEIDKRLAEPRNDLSTSEGRISASAELNILERLKCGAEDKVVLLATDTKDGRICADKIKGAIVKAFCVPAENIDVAQVAGLQIRHTEELRKNGIISLLQKTQEIVEKEKWQYDPVLCPLGGYKGIIPFLAVAGMIFRVPAYYVFEFSDALIKLPPLPVTLDGDLYLKLRPAIQWLDGERGIANEAQFWSKVPNLTTELQELANGFFETTDDGLIALSPLARVFFDQDKNAQSLPLRLSKEAAQFIEEYGDAKTLECFLYKLKSPVWREHNLHQFKKSDLDVYKIPLPHVFRFAGFEKEGIFHLCLAAGDHKTYEREFEQARRCDYEKAQFTDWKPRFREIDADTAAAESENAKIEEVEKLREKANRAANLELENESIRKERNQLKAQLKGLKPSIKKKARKEAPLQPVPSDAVSSDELSSPWVIGYKWEAHMHNATNSIVVFIHDTELAGNKIASSVSKKFGGMRVKIKQIPAETTQLEFPAEHTASVQRILQNGSGKSWLEALNLPSK